MLCNRRITVERKCSELGFFCCLFTHGLVNSLTHKLYMNHLYTCLKASSLVLYSCKFQCGLPMENPAASLQKSHSSVFFAKGDMRAYVTSDVVRTSLAVMFDYPMTFDMVLLVISSQTVIFYYILQVKIQHIK